MKQGIGKKELRVLLLGGAGAGKTALAVMFERKFFHKSYEPTIMAETHSREITVDGQQIQLDVLDCGSSQITDYNQYIKNIDGIVAVYDITSLPSFSKIEPLVKHCQQQKHCPCVLVGTKQDLEKERAIRIQDGTSLANDLGCPFLEITATSEEAVYGMFKLVAKLILDDADPKKVKKGGFKRLLKFKKKKDGTAAEVYEETEEEDSELSQPTTEAVNYNVRKKKEKKEKKEKKRREKEREKEKECIELYSDSDGDPELQQLMHNNFSPPIYVSPKLVARTASPVTVVPTSLSSSNSFSSSSFESTNNYINNNNNNSNNSNNYSNYSIISTGHNNYNSNNVSNNISNSNNNYSNNNSNNNNNNNNSQDTKIINPSPVSSSSSSSTPASTPTSVRAFELIHYMTELKALLIQNKDYASIQTQLVNEREIRLELEMKVLNLQKELQAYKLKYGEL